MGSLVLGFISLFLVWGQLPAGVTGDCYDEPPNNNSYANCATCYQTFANALINTGDNKYRLSRAFFPVSAASPVEVEVSYQRKSDDVVSQTFFWVMGGFYVFQPLDVFLYRSLFFSPPNFRKDDVSVVLPDECFGDESNFTTTSELYGFFEFTTQRLKGYAQSQSAKPAIDSSYVGLAVGKSVDGSSFYITNSDDIIAAAYAIPFFIVVGIVVIAFLGIFFTSMDVASIEESTSYQSNIVSTVLCCVILIVFTVILDVASCVIDATEENLPGYYTHSKKFLAVTVIGLVIYSLFFVVGLCWFILEMFILVFSDKETAGEEATPPHVVEEAQPVEKDAQTPHKKHKSIFEEVRSKFTTQSKRLALICVLIIGGAILSVTAHFPSILMAWATDSFYASRVALFYGIIVFCYFSSFNFTYISSKKAFHDRIDVKGYYYGLVLPAALCCSFLAVSLVVLIITLYVVTVPVNNSIETTSEGVTSIYNGAVVLIGGLLAYKIGWQYFGHSFSVSDALEDALKRINAPSAALERIKEPPPGVGVKKWDNLTEEGRLTEIMVAFGESHTLNKVLQGPALAGTASTNVQSPSINLPLGDHSNGEGT